MRRNMRTCLVLTVYKDRYKKLIEWIASAKSTISDRTDIILLAQSNDETDYTKYCKKPSMKVVTCNAKSIQEKRHFGYHWAIDNNYDALIWMDDDIKYYATHVDFEQKVPSGLWKNLRCDIDDSLLALMDCGERHLDAGICTLFRCGFLATSAKKEYLNQCAHPSQIVYVNLHNTSEKNIDYIESEEWMEDQCFCLDSLVAGLPVYVVGDYSFSTYNSYEDEKNKSLVYSDAQRGMIKRYKQLIRHYLKYGGDLYLNKKGKLTARIKYANYLNARELPVPYSKKGFDEDLMSLCKSREVDEVLVSQVIAYLQMKQEK